jgi:hypothetical protein
MNGKCPGIRSFLCLAVILDLDYLIGRGIFADDIQAIQSAITRIAMVERIKEMQKLRALRNWQEDNA